MWGGVSWFGGVMEIKKLEEREVNYFLERWNHKVFHTWKYKKFIEEAFKDESKVSVVTYEGLTVDFCLKHNVEFILRGLRNPADFEFEKAIAHTNRDLAPIENVFLLTAAKTSYIASSIVRDVIRNNGDYTKLVPKSVRII